MKKRYREERWLNTDGWNWDIASIHTQLHQELARSLAYLRYTNFTTCTEKYLALDNYLMSYFQPLGSMLFQGGNIKIRTSQL